tara:strand:- start:1120 stop:1371 length:252 start_codon:yes stop_codon:yes gene_type:complete
MSKQSVAHDAIASKIVKMMVRETLEAGGNGAEIMVLLESVICGVLCMAGGDDSDALNLEVLTENAKARLPAMRLRLMTPAGQA